MSITPIYTLNFDEIGLKDVARVGGKTPSLGQLFNALKPMGVGVLDGFATTADERNAAVGQMIASAIEAAHFARKPIGICGQAPSDYSDFAAWLVRQGIHSISLNPDTAIKTAFVISEEEAAQAKAAAA